MSVDLDMDAAEYVLGTLDCDERTAFTARLKADAGARAAVASWENRLSDLGEAVQDLTPPQRVWEEIERAVERLPNAPLRFKVIEGGADSTIAPALRRSLNRWRAVAMVSTGIAAALLIFVGAREFSENAALGDSTSYIAAVNRGGDKPALLIRVDLKTHNVYVRPVAAETPTGKSLQLWYIGADKPPLSMGVVDNAPVAMPIPDGARTDASVFAVSVEPVGGSKTGGPTGPVVYSGELIKD